MKKKYLIGLGIFIPIIIALIIIFGRSSNYSKYAREYLLHIGMQDEDINKLIKKLERKN